jgi:hypothetical protein
MSILDSFYILFKSQGTDEVKKSLDGVNSATNKVSESFKKMSHELTGAIAGFISLGAILEGLKSSLSYAVRLDQASQSLAVNIDELDAWGNAVTRIGGTAEAFQGSLKNLAQRLGTSGEVALKVLPQLADSFQKMGRFSAIRYGESLGLDEKTILLLQKGRLEVEATIRQQKELGLVSKKDAEAAREFNYAWQDATHAFRMAFLGAAETVLPVITGIVTAFGKAAEYFQKHSDLIIGALAAIGIAAALAFSEFFVAIAVVGALAGAFALLYEDIKYYIQGQDSFIGHLLKRWPLITKAIHATAQEFQKLINLFSNLYEKYYKFMSGGKEFKIQGEYGEDGAKNKSFALSTQEIAALSDSKLAHAKKVLDIATTSTVAFSRPADLQKYAISSGNKSVTINTGDINIHTQATDGDGVFQAFTKSLNEQLLQANNYFDDGVKI